MGCKGNRVNMYVLSDVSYMQLTLSKVAFLVFGNDKNEYSDRANFTIALTCKTMIEIEVGN